MHSLGPGIHPPNQRWSWSHLAVRLLGSEVLSDLPIPEVLKPYLPYPKRTREGGYRAALQSLPKARRQRGNGFEGACHRELAIATQKPLLCFGPQRLAWRADEAALQRTNRDVPMPLSDRR